MVAFSRSMMSKEAIHNASAVPATIRMNAILNSCRDVTETMVLLNRSDTRKIKEEGLPRRGNGQPRVQDAAS